jgi:hypothetical protein
MKKSLNVPVSTPNRIIIEPNPPRQGYSRLTWFCLNEYYLQNVMNQKKYNDLLISCAKVCFEVYSANREENRFLKGSLIDKL